ncbi:hypothetical protein D3C81_1194210 [compost metagenome]
MGAQPVEHLLPAHAGPLAQQRCHPPAQGGAAQACAGQATCAHMATEVRLRAAEPRPLPGCTTGIARHANHPRIAGWIHRTTLRRAGCAQQHARGLGLGTGLVQHRPVLKQAKAEVDQRRTLFHQPQQRGGHLQRAGARLRAEHLGQQQWHGARLTQQARDNRTAMPQLVRQRFAFAQHALLKPEPARPQQLRCLGRRTATVDNPNAQLSAHA